MPLPGHPSKAAWAAKSAFPSMVIGSCDVSAWIASSEPVLEAIAKTGSDMDAARMNAAMMVNALFGTLTTEF